MPKFTIGRSYGYAGTSSESVVECDTLEEAEEWAYAWAMDNVEAWAVPYEEE